MNDIEIAHSIKLRDIRDIAAQLSIPEDDLVRYGRYKAKLPHKLIDRRKAEQGSLVLVSAISPTPAGEGKTTVSIGLTLGL
ncbi:MAG TPA: formate--tetrahydrofolate ligase, partial [Elusimicrobiales bacterium]|nr:formate--tetrahydrofolate ligase [Elusimicrobiales bacterium]